MGAVPLRGGGRRAASSDAAARLPICTEVPLACIQALVLHGAPGVQTHLNPLVSNSRRRRRCRRAHGNGGRRRPAAAARLGAPGRSQAADPATQCRSAARQGAWRSALQGGAHDGSQEECLRQTLRARACLRGVCAEEAGRRKECLPSRRTALAIEWHEIRQYDGGPDSLPPRSTRVLSTCSCLPASPQQQHFTACHNPRTSCSSQQHQALQRGGTAVVAARTQEARMTAQPAVERPPGGIAFNTQLLSFVRQGRPAGRHLLLPCAAARICRSPRLDSDRSVELPASMSLFGRRLRRLLGRLLL